MYSVKMPTMDSVARFKAAMDSDKGALGPFMIGTDPAFVEAAGYAGYDFVLLDMEHGTTTFQTLPNLIRAANVAGVCPVVRVPRGTDIWIDQALDVGAGAIMIPQIDTAEQARAAVSAAKFSPVGTRGTCRFVRSAGFGAVPGSEYFSKAQDTVVILQAEGTKAVENLDEILDVPGIDVVLGYCGYASGRGWLQRCAAYDALLLGMRYLGAAIGRQPYLGLGGNLAYRKEAFFRQKGFSAHLNLLRGDDDLFVNSVATGRNTQVETDARATVRRPPCMRAKDWREEKIGRASTARLYRGWARYLLGFDTLTRLLFHAAWITTLCIGLVRGQWFVAGLAVLAFLVRWTVQAYAVRRTARALGEERRYLFSLPIFDLLHPLQSLRWRLVCRMRGKGEFMRR